MPNPNYADSRKGRAKLVAAPRLPRVNYLAIASRLDRLADLRLNFGDVAAAERLAHQAAELRAVTQ